MRRILLAAVLVLSACAIEQRDGRTVTEFAPPFVFPDWRKQSYRDEDGKPVCAVSSGMRGISVYVRKTPEGGEGVSIRSNRTLLPGASLALDVNGHHYITSVDFFASADAARIVADFMTAEKAYLEWSEISSADRSRLHTSNILMLDGFRPLWAECRASL